MSDSASSQICRGLSWSYDAWGNLSSQSVTAGSCAAFSVVPGTNNQLGSPFQYDAAGNMTYDGANYYFYDAENRLIQVNGTLGSCSSATVCYVYDALGQRIRHVLSGGAQEYIQDVQGHVVADYTYTSSYTGLGEAYAYLGSQLLAIYENATTYFVTPDHLGSTRVVTGVNQSVQEGLDYYPFGQVSNDDYYTTHEFAGMILDYETGLNHADFRQYRNALGRWMTPDPAGLAAVDPTNPQSWNRYAYVLNNPLANIDPSGLLCVDANGNGIVDENGNPIDESACGAPGPGAGGTWIPPAPPTTVQVTAPAGSSGPVTIVWYYGGVPMDSSGGNGYSVPSLWAISRSLNTCAAQLAQTKSASATLGVPEVLGSNFFSDVSTLATGGGGIDQGAGIATEGVVQVAEHAGAQIAVNVSPYVSMPISATSGVYNPISVATSSQSLGGTLAGRIGLGLLKAASLVKTVYDAGTYLGAEAVCAAPAWNH